MKYLLSLLITLSSVSVFAENFSKNSDGEFITMSGKVSEAKGSSFHMNASDKKIKVTMDNYSLWQQDGFKIKKGDDVIVTGRVDHDLFEKKTLNAGGVYVKNIGTYFHADSTDKSYLPALSSSYLSIKNLPENTSADITGKVINVKGREFTVDTGWRKVQVETANMSYNPLDSTGLTKIKKGDRVTVSGVVDDSYFDEKELSANYIIEHSNTSTYSE